MPVGNSSGSWTAVKVSPTAVQAMPGPLAQTWSDYQDAITALGHARQAHRQALEAVRLAPQADREAAARAITSQSPMPGETVTAAKDAADQALRNVDGRTLIAQRTEAAFLAAARWHRLDWHQNLTTQAQAHRDRALALLDELASEAKALSDGLTARRYAASDDAIGRPQGTGATDLRVTVQGAKVTWDRVLSALSATLEASAPSSSDEVRAQEQARAQAVADQMAKYPSGILPPGVEAARV